MVKFGVEIAVHNVHFFMNDAKQQINDPDDLSNFILLCLGAQNNGRARECFYSSQ
jgi:hypothetical protein